MKKQFVFIFMAAGILAIASCQDADRSSSKEETAPADTSITPAPAQDSIVTSSLTDAKGNTLKMAFNNAAGTAKFILATDTISLKQDTTASGIRYSNEHYIYVEHHGSGTLTKDGKVIFEHNQ